jgi:transcription initiation factor TFIID subunit 13
MVDDNPEQQKAARQVHFDEDPVSNVFVFPRPAPNIILRVTPPSPQSFAPRTDANASSPTPTSGTKRSHREISPSLEPSRSGADTPSSGGDDLLGCNTAENEQRWSRGHESGAIEDSRTSQMPNARTPTQGVWFVIANPLTVQHFLYSYGDVRESLDTTRRVLDELVTDFVTELCFEASRSAQLAGRQKIKIDDIRFACRKSPMYLGKIQDIQEKKEVIDNARKTLDVNDDKITKSNVKALEDEPPLGDDDDDVDMDTQISRGKGAGK